jgi:hypothetical protein
MLDWFTQFGNQIASFGLTTQSLFIALGLLSLVLFWSAREFMAWYFKSNRILAQQEELISRLMKIEDQLNQLKNSGEQIQTILESQGPQFPLSIGTHGPSATAANKEPWMNKPLI